MLRKIIITCLLIGLTLAAQSCKCPEKRAKKPKELTFSKCPLYPDAIVDDVNYGVPFVLGKLVFLKGDFEVKKGMKQLEHKCPRGFRLPTEEEYNTLLSQLSSPYETLANAEKFNLQEGKFYMTSTKSYPNNVSGGSVEAWEWKTLTSEKKTLSTKSICTYWYEDKMVGKCVLDTQNFDMIKAPSRDVYTFQEFEYYLDHTFLRGGYMYVNGKKGYGMRGYSMRPGCDILEAYGYTHAAELVYQCKAVHILQSMGDDSIDSDFDLYRVRDYGTQKKAFASEQVFFKHSEAPVAPKAEGGYYMIYSSNPDYTLHIRHTNDTFTAANKVEDVELNITGYPIDIIETDYGLIFYAVNDEDTDNSFVVGLDKEFKVLFKTTIMNNGLYPTSIKEQITFYDDKSKPLFGMEAMHEPENGKFAYGKGKVALIFTHYNNFGASTGVRNDHTGDTWITIEDDGSISDYAWAWGSSHSLIQSHIYDGKYFLTAALGDAYPMGIRICAIDVDQRTDAYDPIHKKNNQYKSWCKDDILPYMLGTHYGNTAGRLGGLLNLGDKFAVVYSIMPIQNSIENELGLVTFKFDNGEFTDIEKFVIKKDFVKEPYANVHSVRSAKFGNKILITYTVTKEKFYWGTTQYSYNKEDKAYYLLVSRKGEIVTGPIEAKSPQMNHWDDIRPLSDGSLLWSYVNDEEELRYVVVTSPVWVFHS